MIARYLRSGFEFALAHAVEEAGEFLAAAGKTQRWGRQSVNPDLPAAEQETNEDWLVREMADLQGAIGRLGVALSSRVEDEQHAPASPWSTEVEVEDDGWIKVILMVSTCSGPVRQFRPYLDVDLDEAHATELLGKLALALQRSRIQRGEPT